MNYRVYFHKRNGNDPVVWSMDEGTQVSEIHIQGVAIARGVSATTGTNLEPKEGEPAGWLNLHGAKFKLTNGWAYFEPEVSFGAGLGGGING
jgi:hypothetical protein